MLALAVLIAISGSTPSSLEFQVQVRVSQGSDTTRTTFRLAEGIEGRAIVQGPKSFTRVHATVRRATSEGCLRVTVGSGAAPDEAGVGRVKGQPAPVIELCGTSTANLSMEGGPSYQVTVHEVSAPE